MFVLGSNFVPFTADGFFGGGFHFFSIIDPNLQILGLFVITGDEGEGRRLCKQVCYTGFAQAAYSDNSLAMAVQVVT